MKFRTLCLVFVRLLSFNSLAEAILIEKVTQNYLWDGVVAYIAVDRQVIQDKLDAWHESISPACEGTILYLPNSTVFPDSQLDKNQHVIYIGTGYVDFYDFQDLPHESFSANGMEFAVVIPFLSDAPNGSPHYSLALKNFYERDRGDIPKPNIALPYVPVDEITRNETSVVVRNGSEEIQLSFPRRNDRCKPPNAVVRHEIDEYFDREFQFGVSEPDFTFCDCHPGRNQYCRIVERIKCGAHRSYPNVCQTSWKSTSKASCKSPLQIVNITERFREMMLFGDGELKVVATEWISGNFSVGLKYPCIE